MSKIEQWEITLPVPLVISSEITDEEIITEMTSATTDMEISSIISSAFEPASKSFIVSCTKEELLELMMLENNKYIIELQEYDDMFMIVVVDSTGSVVGRGEIFKAGKKVNKEKFRKEFLKNIEEFDKKFVEGEKRMNNLVYKLKTIRNIITTDADLDFTKN